MRMQHIGSALDWSASFLVASIALFWFSHHAATLAVTWPQRVLRVLAALSLVTGLAIDPPTRDLVWWLFAGAAILVALFVLIPNAHKGAS